MEGPAGMTHTSPIQPPSPPPPEPVSKRSLLLTGLSGLLGALLGGLVQYVTGTWLETDKQHLQIQMAAYADFAKAQAAWQRAQQAEDDARKKPKPGDARKNPVIEDAKLKIRDAAFRIVMFSPADVVEAWAAFTREDHPEACAPVPSQADLAVYRSMRRQVRHDAVADADVVMALFGCRLTEPARRDAPGAAPSP